MAKLPILLVVEDDDEVREAIVDCLCDIDIHILTAEHGKAALAILEQHKVIAVLSDFNMPHMDGLTLLRTVRDMGQDIPFVILSGHADRHNTVEAMRLGALDLMAKPFRVMELRSAVENAIQYGLQLRALELQLEALSKDSSDSPEVQKIKELKKNLIETRYRQAHKKTA